jgi:anti-anti-sigma factor
MKGKKMELNVINKDDFTIIKFNMDKLLGTEAAEFQNTVLDVLEKKVKSIVVDLSTVHYITSWAIGMLVHAFTTATNRNVKFVLSGVSARVHEILSKVKLDTIFTFSDIK